jgi:hypothetical protein
MLLSKVAKLGSWGGSTSMPAGTELPTTPVAYLEIERVLTILTEGHLLDGLIELP